MHLVVEDGFGQIFITDSNKVRVEEIIRALGGPSKIFRVKEGVFTHEKTENEAAERNT